MIVMAADYVGSKVVKYLSDNDENIEILVLDSGDRGGFNNEIIKTSLTNNSKVEIFNELQIKDETIKKYIYSKNIDFGILAWWPNIIDKSIISLTKKGFINTHPGYLPYNKGKHPYFWSIVDETPFGATIHYVDENIDNGDIIAQGKIDLEWEDTGETLYNKSRDLVLKLFYENFYKIKNDNIHPLKQNNDEATFHYGKELDAICKINLEKEYKAKDLINIIRGRMFRGKGESYFIDKGTKYNISIYIEKAI